MRKLKYFRTVCYYDGPQVVELHDYYGGSYIGVAIDGNCERYVATGVSPASLQGFCEGVTDLRSLMLEFGSSEWYMSAGDVNWQVDLTFELQNSSLAESEYLPEAGFTTHAPGSD
jgi:hypothetical protein